MDIQTNTFQDITDKKNSLLQNAEQIRQGWHEDAELFNDGQPLTMRELSMLSNIRQISKDLTADTQKFAQALLISKHRPDTDIADAWANLDLYTKEVIGKPAEYTKGRTQALMDMYKVTDLSIQRGKKALEWAKYDQAEDEDGKAKIAEELKAFDEQIASLQEHMPTDSLTTVLGWFAGNAPYMIDIAKEGGKGGAIATVGTGIAALALGLPFTAPLALGTAATLASTAFTAGSLVSGALDMKNIAKGAMYYELRQNGVEKDIAEWASEANGWLQAWIEMGLGATSAAKGLVMKGTGLDKVAYKTAVKLYASGKLGALARGLYNAAKTGAGEGAEEFFQGEAEWLTKLIVSELSDSGYTPDQTAAEALKQSVYEGLVGTAVGFGLGLPMDIVNTRMDMKYAQYLKDDAEFKSSKSSYIKKHMDDAIFSEMSEKQREDILGKIYDKNHRNTDKEKARQQKEADIQKRKDALNAEKEDLQSQPESEFRDKRIDAIDTELADIERQEKESRAAGFRNNTENARQNYYEDPNAETKQNLDDVTEEQRQFEEQEGISEKQKEYNEAIESRLDRDMTEEEVDNLVNLDQDVQTERARRVQTEEEQDWQKSPEEIEQVMSEPMNISDEERKNFVSLIKNKTQGQKISTREAEAILPMFNAIARGMGISVDDFISNHMMPEVARNVRVGETIDIDGQSVTLTPPNGGVAKGAVYFNPKDGKAIILLTEKADFSTWVHETGHIMRRYIQGDMLSSLENHYNVKEGKWTVAAEEQFTEDLTTYLMTRQAPTSQLKKVFQMIADALLNIYRDISKREKVSDDIARVFDQLFSDGRSAFSQEYNYDPDSMLYQITPEERAEADRQYAEVVAKYKGTDQWLKAPNGQPTKLTERQWVQVRTPNFINWFGDWINDPQNASKVVDENGEPKVVYHWTGNSFDVFDMNKARQSMDIVGAYFSEDPTATAEFGGWNGNPKDIPKLIAKGRRIEAFLNIKNPAENPKWDYGTTDTAGLDERNKLIAEGYDGVVVGDEWTAFEPNQIKSATDNVGTFSESNPSILFQSIGEEGATALDRAEETTYRMDNLKTAKDMEKEGKDAKAIKYATGWERGKDKKWRYETDKDIELKDLGIEFKEADDKIKESRNKFDEQFPPIKARLDEIAKGKTLSPSLYFEQQKLKNKWRELYDEWAKKVYDKIDLWHKKYGYEGAELSEIVNNKELFKAYPQLKDIKVFLAEPGAMGNAAGRWTAGLKTIEVLATLSPERMTSILVHEIQHAIQDIEGFAEGGNEEVAKQLLEKENKEIQTLLDKADAWEWKLELEETEKQHPELAGTVDLLNALVKEYEGFPSWMPSEDVRAKGFNLYVRGYDKEGYEDAYKEWQELASKNGIPEKTVINDLTVFRTYQRLAGEVEARNAQTRMNMAPEERRNTLLSETEDVAREDQIVLMDGLEAQMSVEDMVNKAEHTNLLFQSAYHGSGASFDKFDTDFIGTGEGAQAFGWGIYLTQSEGIARDYAKRMGGDENPVLFGKELYEFNGSDDIAENAAWVYASGKPTTKEEAIKYAEENISATKELIASNAKWSGLDRALKHYELALEYFKKHGIEGLSIAQHRNLYTVSIPDDTGSNYLYWDKNYKGKEKETIRERIEAQFDKEGLSWQPKYKHIRWNSEMNYKRGTDGRFIYELIKEVFKEQEMIKGKFGASMRDYAQQASEFLNRAGFVGIDYPANSMSGGNKYGKRNFVIFNADDITIDNHLLYQENEEIYRDATENGEYVPDNILEQFKGNEWADLEIAAREDYRKTALEYEDDYTKFLEFNKTFDISDRTDDYYNEVYNSAFTSDMQSREEANRQFLDSMTHDEMEKILNIIAKTDAFHNGQVSVPHPLVENTLRGMVKGDKAISQGNYQKIMALMKDDPDAYREMFALAFEDQEQFELIQKQKALFPPTEMEKLRAENRELRADAKRAKQSLKEVDRKIADLRDDIHFWKTRLDKYKIKTEAEIETLKEDKDYLKARAKLEKYLAWYKAQEKMAAEKIKAGMRLDSTKERLEGKLNDQRAYYQSRLDELKQAYKERAYYQRLMKIIFRKPPNMCLNEIANKIIEIQSQYSPSTMMEQTRAKLLAELDKTENPRLKSKIQQRLDRKSLREMALAEVEKIADEIVALRAEGVQKRMEQLLEIKEARLDQIAKLSKDLGNTAPVDKTGSIEGKDNKGSIYDRFVSYWADIHRMTDRMGENWREWLGKIKTAHEDELRNVDRRRTAFRDKMKELKLDENILSKVETIDGKKYTHDILMCWYAYAQNEDSLAALIYGNFKGTPETEGEVRATIEEGIGKLTPNEIKLADWAIESFTGADWTRVADAVRFVENRSPEKVQRYFPMHRVLDNAKDAQNEPLVDLGERTAGARMSSVRKGFTKERIHNISWEHQKAIQLGFMSIYMKAIQNQEHYIAFAQLSKDMKYEYGNVSEKVASKYGTSWDASMSAWIDRTINPNIYNTFYSHQTMFDKLMSNTVIGSLSYNMLSWIKQFPSVMFFLPYCSGGSLMNSLFHYVTDFKEMTKFAKDRSPYLKNRNIDDVINLVQKRLQDPNAKFRGLTKFTEWGMKPYGWFDEFACVIGWNAVYTSQMENGATEEQAIAKANEALLKTQPQADALFSPIAYGDRRWRPFLLFTRQANQITQMIMSDTVNNGLSETAKAEKVKFFYRLVFCVLLNALLMGWAGRKFGGYGDDDKDKSVAEDVLREIGSNAAYNFPIVGGTIANAIQRKNYTSGGYVDPLSDLIGSVGNFTNKPIKNGELNYDQLMRMLTTSMGVAGLPKVAAQRAYNGIKENDLFWYMVMGAPLGGKQNEKTTNKFKKK